MGQAPRRVLALARVSSADQEARGTSLDAQQDRFRAYCRERDYPAPLLYVEVESAGEERREKRVELDRLLADARPGDLILCLVTDRWTRDVVAGVADVRRLLKLGAGWIAIDEEIDARTDHGYEQLLQRAAGAEMERRRIRKRTVGARQRLRALGYHVEGLPPPGLRIVERKLVADPTRVETIRRMFQLAIEGQSTRQISRALGSLPGLDHAAIARRLRDRRYLGESCTAGARNPKGRATAGEWRPTHEAIVDRATWDAAQEALGGRRMGGRPVTGESRVAAFLLRGLATCGACGARLRSQAPMPGSSTKHAGWYVCLACGVHARQDAADARAGELVLEHLDRERERLRRPPAPTPKAPDLAAERARLVARLDRLLDAIADGTVSRERAGAKVAETERAIADVDARRAAADPPRAPARADLLVAVDGLRLAWEGLTTDERRAALRGLATQATITRKGAKWARGAWEIEICWRES